MRQVTPPSADAPPRPVQQSFDFTPSPPPAVRSPGPSRLAFRMTRLWKKVWVRRLVLVVLPVCLSGALSVQTAMDPTVRAFVAEKRVAVMDRLSARPEFAIRGARIIGASSKLKASIEEIVTVPPGASTLTFDVAAAQAAVNDLAAVREARVTLAPDGRLDILVIERIPRALWRDGEDRLWLVDEDGIAVGPAGSRADHPRLPLLLGQGADKAVEEALDLLAAAPDLTPRIRALVRVGQRRWDVVLDHELTILLPEETAPAALARVMAWHYGEQVLDRGLARIDMRLSDRPTLRMTPKALELRPLVERLRERAGEET